MFDELSARIADRRLMFNYVLKRILLLLPTFIGITIVSFGFVRVLPGDPVLLMAGERGLTDEDIQRY